MKQPLMMALVLVAVTGAASAQASNKGQTALFEEIERMDSALSDAFNNRDLKKLMGLFRTDLEFYQDNKGLVLYQQTAKDFESLLGQNNGLRRELVKGTLEVYPIKDFGALELGSHKFCHFEDGKEECGTFKFVHVWQKQDGQWKIARVISYEH